MDIIPYEAGSFYVADKGYTDFMRLYKVHTNGSFFVTRAKENLQFKRICSRAVNKTNGVQSDQIGKLVVYKSKNEYPEKLRRIKYYDSEHDKYLVFLTNNMDLKASEIAFLYKKRWEVELFFKWMKQHLKIKAFWGRTLNAVKIQMYCAVIAYCLVASIGYKLKVDRSIYEILQILSISLLDKTSIKEILTRCNYHNVKEQKNNQLIISGF
jgi:IS4 transposase